MRKKSLSGISGAFEVAAASDTPTVMLRDNGGGVNRGRDLFHVDCHQMLAAGKYHSVAFFGGEEVQFGVCAINFKTGWLSIHNSQCPRRSLVRQLNARPCNQLGGSKITIEVQHARSRTFGRRLDDVSTGGKPCCDAVFHGPRLTIHSDASTPRDSHAAR